MYEELALKRHVKLDALTWGSHCGGEKTGVDTERERRVGGGSGNASGSQKRDVLECSAGVGAASDSRREGRVRAGGRGKDSGGSVCAETSRGHLLAGNEDVERMVVSRTDANEDEDDDKQNC